MSSVMSSESESSTALRDRLDEALCEGVVALFSRLRAGILPRLTEAAGVVEMLVPGVS